MRTGSEYRHALHDGRKVWVIGEGFVEDVTRHPATRVVVDEYVAWYDCHFDPEWQNILLTPPDDAGDRLPWGYVIPNSADDLHHMGRCFSKATFLSAGNLTHTPAYGALIALGVLSATQEASVSPKQIGDAARYRELIARAGRFLTFSAGAATLSPARGPGRAGRAQDRPRNRRRARSLGQDRHAYQPGLRRGCLCRCTFRCRYRSASRHLHRAGRRTGGDGRSLRRGDTLSRNGKVSIKPDRPIAGA
jgi:hypothetical protein